MINSVETSYLSNFNSDNNPPKFILEVPPSKVNYSDITLSRLSNIEHKLQDVLFRNTFSHSLVNGIFVHFLYLIQVH